MTLMGKLHVGSKSSFAVWVDVRGDRLEMCPERSQGVVGWVQWGAQTHASELLKRGSS